ncbi:FAD-dependent monooxygenase [Streptomyces xanthophaeus]|uniref:FAD-dependent monooxygenase n=1 Tax=Streptomyces xanthophaeus TaxID=67385 RepID=UPI003437EA9B
MLPIGDAAHVCSPIGGQRLDLGLRDAVSLAAVLARASGRRGHADGLTAWRRARRAEALGVLARTDRAARDTPFAAS